MENIERLKISWIQIHSHYMVYPSFGGFEVAYRMLRSEKKLLGL